MPGRVCDFNCVFMPGGACDFSNVFIHLGIKFYTFVCSAYDYHKSFEIYTQGQGHLMEGQVQYQILPFVLF